MYSNYYGSLDQLSSFISPLYMVGPLFQLLWPPGTWLGALVVPGTWLGALVGPWYMVGSSCGSLVHGWVSGSALVGPGTRLGLVGRVSGSAYMGLWFGPWLGL